jgi:hypothetical protein
VGCLPLSFLPHGHFALSRDAFLPLNRISMMSHEAQMTQSLQGATACSNRGRTGKFRPSDHPVGTWSPRQRARAKVAVRVVLIRSSGANGPILRESVASFRLY